MVSTNEKNNSLRNNSIFMLCSSKLWLNLFYCNLNEGIHRVQNIHGNIVVRIEKIVHFSELGIYENTFMFIQWFGQLWVHNLANFSKIILFSESIVYKKLYIK